MAWGTVLEGTLVTNVSTDMKATGTVVSPHASTNEGDLIVAILGLRSTVGWNHNYQTPAGWEKLFAENDGAGTNRAHAMFGKYAGASEGSSTFKTDEDRDSPANFGRILTIPGGDPSTILDVTYNDTNHHTEKTNVGSTNTTVHDPITTNTDNAYVIHYMHGNGDDTINATAASTGYTILSSQIADDNYQYIIQAKIVPTAGTETPDAAAFTCDSFTLDASYYTIALKGVLDIPNKIIQVKRSIQRASYI